MPQLQFESLGQSLARLPQVIQSIPDILRNPSANPLQAAILLTITVVVVLIILLSIILLFVRPAREEEYYEEGAAAEPYYGEAGEEAAGEAPQLPALGPLMTWSLVVLLFAAVWVAAGISTSSSDVCASCHTSTVHTKSNAEDPHAAVRCVDCHESGGPVARVTVNVFTRIQHIVLARADSPAALSYGTPVASDACVRCHRSQIVGTQTNRALGVRVSHSQPLAAGASCVDCHALQSGVVTASTIGMSPCLRCHDGKHAKSECSECHIGDPSRAIQPTVAVNSLATAQVPNPVCTGCHTDMTKCNACHGLSMPHSPQFMAYGHALVASQELWNTGNLNVCTKCHYPGHNYCIQPGCHTALFPAHGLVWKTMHGMTSWSGSNVRCACHNWNPYQHNGMNFCQICHATKPPGTRP